MNYRRPSNLLSIDTNAKTVKGQEYGFLTGILYLAPADLSGKNLCAMAEVAGCKEACLYSAGRGAFNSVQQARLNKTQYYLQDREAFLLHLVKDIEKLIKKANRLGLTPLVRLNGTSDIRWELERFSYEFYLGKIRDVNLMELFPEVQFYDYTKIANRKDIPVNYDLTFSYSGKREYLPHVNKAVEAGMRVAVVFRTEAEIPESFLGREVVGGDNSDIRHLDPMNSVVALYAKGAAKKDLSGFVVDTFKGIPVEVTA
jgi:hypothetical protein